MTENSGGLDRRGRWSRASATALQNEAEGATARLLVEQHGAAVMVVKRQGSYLSSGSGGTNEAQTKLELLRCPSKHQGFLS